MSFAWQAKSSWAARAMAASCAAEHIAAAFGKLKLKPAFGDSYFQPIPWLLTTPREDGKTYVGRNIAGYIPGSDPKLADEWIILAAHYDHLGVRKGKVHPGADDNASGVAMLLEVAEAFALGEKKPARSVYFISFDLEEDGLQGSTHFAAHPPRELAKLKSFLVADLLGRSFGDVMDEWMFVLGSETSPRLRTLVTDTKPEDGLTIGRLGADLVGTRSDYGPFRDRKVPFLFFTTGTHRDYHRPTDLPERLNYEKLAKSSRWISHITMTLANDEAPKWEPSAKPDLLEAEVALALFTRVLERPIVVPMTDEKKKFVTNARDRLAGIVERKTVTDAERKWIVDTARWAILNLY